MKKMVARSAFYWYEGYDEKDVEITHGDGIVIDMDISKMREAILNQAKKCNEKVFSIRLKALTPIQFEIQE